MKQYENIDIEKEHEILRITLTSKHLISLEKACKEIIEKNKENNYQIRGPIRIPTKKINLNVRKSPCGEGTNTWDKFEMKIHKRIIDFHSNKSEFNSITPINLDNGIEIDAQILKKM